jgi:hypothetical protein
MSDLTTKIQSKGYWAVAIHPATFVEERVPYEDLDEIIPALAVRLRGWPVPFANEGRHERVRGNDWVGQDVDATTVSMYEAWRLFSSGLFTHLRAVSADWRSGAETTPIEAGFDSAIEVWEILFYLTEIFELATRLAFSIAGDEEMVIEVGLHNLENRGLVVGQSNRVPFSQPYRSHVPTIEREVHLSREQLAGGGRKEAVEMARQFFLRFGWKPSAQQLIEHQRELVDH